MYTYVMLEQGDLKVGRARKIVWYFRIVLLDQNTKINQKHVNKGKCDHSERAFPQNLYIMIQKQENSRVCRNYDFTHTSYRSQDCDEGSRGDT